jgi:hypothetical protein
MLISERVWPRISGQINLPIDMTEKPLRPGVQPFRLAKGTGTPRSHVKWRAAVVTVVADSKGASQGVSAPCWPLCKVWLQIQPPKPDSWEHPLWVLRSRSPQKLNLSKAVVAVRRLNWLTPVASPVSGAGCCGSRRVDVKRTPACPRRADIAHAI